jgi:hypothetical protein
MDATIHKASRIEIRGGVIEVISGRGSPRTLSVGADSQVIGRHAGCGLVLEDKLVSGMYAEVIATEQGLRVRDFGSRNGTFLNEHRVEAVVFSNRVQCGDSVLEIRPGKPEKLPMSRSHRFGGLVGASPKMRALFGQLQRLASTTVSARRNRDGQGARRGSHPRGERSRQGAVHRHRLHENPAATRGEHSVRT